MGTLLRSLTPRVSAVTFDVGRSGVRAAQVAARGRNRIAAETLRVELPAAAIRSTDPNPPPDPQRLARMLEQGRFRGEAIGLVLSPPDVHYHALRLPDAALRQPPERVHQALAWEVARETRTEPGELEVRYWLLPEGHREDVNVMAVAVRSAQANELARNAAGCGLRLKALTVSAPALVQSAGLLFEPEANDLWGILDLGMHRTQIIAVVGQTPVYVRSVAVSGDEWTRRLAEGFEASYAEAERIKRDYGISAESRLEPKPGRDEPLVLEEGVAAICHRLLQDSLQKLLRELNVCLSYVLQYYPRATPTRLILAGGGAELRGLDEYIETVSGVRTMVLRGAACERPGRGVGGVYADLTPGNAVAIGAGLLELEKR